MVVLRRVPPVILRLLVPLALLLLVAPLVGAQGTAQQAPLPPPPGTAPPFSLYMSGGPGAMGQFTPLESRTLADINGQMLDVGPLTGPWLVSGDGSTAAMESNGDVIVWDVHSGRKRSQFYPSASTGLLRLSRDGSRLVLGVSVDYSAADLRQPAWKVFDTTTGCLIATVQGDGANPGPACWLDASGRRLYWLRAPTTKPGAASPPVQLVADDLTTGKEIGRVALPGVVAGGWPTDQQVGGETVMAEYMPGIALSPDGRTLAVVHVDRQALTLVDTQRLAVTRTVPLTRPRSLLDRVLGLLPLAPQSAAAKALEGIYLGATFAADGQHLYVSGTEYSMNGNDVATKNLGLMVVDIRGGRITATAFAGMRSDSILPAPDGHSVYVLAEEPSFALYRLDATTLKPLARRDLTGYRMLLLWPAVPNAQ